MESLDPILIGATVLLAGAGVGVVAILSPANRAAAVYAQLVLMVGIYVGFAINGLDPIESASRAAWSAVLVESLTALAFVLGGLGVLTSTRQWMLGGMILAHGGVDLLHMLLSASYSPDWYAFLCLIYDAIVGVAAIWLLSNPNGASKSS